VITDVLDALHSGGHRIAASVPDRGLDPLLVALSADGRFVHVPCTREEEAVGLCAGAFFAGSRGVLLMQSSGVGNCVNALLSLVSFYQVPILLLVSVRGGPGEPIKAQLPMGASLRPILESCGLQILEPQLPQDLVDMVAAPPPRAALLATPNKWLELLRSQ